MKLFEVEAEAVVFELSFTDELEDLAGVVDEVWPLELLLVVEAFAEVVEEDFSFSGLDEVEAGFELVFEVSTPGLDEVVDDLSPCQSFHSADVVGSTCLEVVFELSPCFLLVVELSQSPQ